jgi:signal transduction histidine kinase
MTQTTGLPLPLQALLWAGVNSIAGAAVGLAVGFFRQGGVEPTILTVGVLFGNVIGFTVLASTALLSPRLRSVGPWVRAMLLGLALISGAVAGTSLVIVLFPLFVLRDIRQALAVVAINGLLALIVGGVVHAYEGMRWRLAESLREVEEVRLVEAQLRELAARAELAALQARINPHFFFNTLNTISSLVDEDPERAGEIVQGLSELFRYTFRVAEARPVALSEELEFIQRYLSVERARFGDRLKVIREVEDRSLAVPIPGLILQPLVENAVGHGIAPLRRGGTVRIVARLDGGDLVIEVADDGVGLDLKRTDVIREGHGLANVRQRRSTLYGARGSLELLPGTDDHGAIARIRLPVQATAATRDTRQAPAAASGRIEEWRRT